MFLAVLVAFLDVATDVLHHLDRGSADINHVAAVEFDFFLEDLGHLGHAVFFQH